MSFDYERWKEQQYTAASDPPAPADGCPTVVYLAATIWTAVGLIQLLTVLLYVLKSGQFNKLGGLIALGLMHLFCGLRTLSGTAPGTVRYGVVSIVFGLAWLTVAALSAGPAATNPNAPANATLVVLGIAVGGGALLLAGCLAVSASASYRRWCDPHGSGADETAREQRGRASASPKGGAATKPSVPAWVWALVGSGALLVMALFGGAVLLVKFRPPKGNSKPSAVIEEYGRYRSNGRTHTEPNRNAAGGVNVLNNGGVTLLEQTDQISCKVGEQWGIRLRSSNVPANKPHTVRQEMYHPPIRQPDGAVRTKSVREVKVQAGGSPDQFYGWQFLDGYENELVAGEWSIVVLIDDVEVARKSFHIRK